MRNICTDEAGTAANEAVSVVLALIVNPDRQWFPVVAALATLYQTYVPEQYRTGFAFHGRKLFGQNKYPGWDYDERKALMRCVMTLPSKFNIIVLSYRHYRVNRCFPVTVLRNRDNHHSNRYATSESACPPLPDEIRVRSCDVEIPPPVKSRRSRKPGEPRPEHCLSIGASAHTRLTSQSECILRQVADQGPGPVRLDQPTGSAAAQRADPFHCERRTHSRHALRRLQQPRSVPMRDHGWLRSRRKVWRPAPQIHCSSRIPRHTADHIAQSPNLLHGAEQLLALSRRQ